MLPTMSISDLPAIKVLIKPLFDSNANVTSLFVSLTVDAILGGSEETLLSIPRTAQDLSVEEQAGSMKAVASDVNLPVTFDEHGIRWMCKPSESLMLSYKITPGSFSDLSQDQGGVIGAGVSFTPVLQNTQVYRNIVEWDISQAPEGTRAVWTFGEGPAAVEKVGQASILFDSVYMVGPIHSNPPIPPPGSFYGYYWFGDLPSNIAVIKDIHHDFFLKVSSFFQDSPSTANPYRSFVHKTATPSFGGKSYLRSHIFSYSSQILSAHDYDLVRRMAYETIHNFLGPSPSDPAIDWLFEGIKNTLSIYLPFRTGFRTPDYFESTMAMQSMKYYTNPLINLTHEEALDRAPTDSYAQELISSRAWVFVILMDFRARIVAEEKRPDLMPRPVEDLAIKPLAANKRDGQPHGIEQWIELMKPLMGDEFQDLYEHMRSGRKIILPEKFFGSKTHRMASVKQETLDFGMDRESFTVEVVRGLKVGSRAEKAGLREGDRILSSSEVWKCVDHYEAEMELVVEREGVGEVLRYWPRSGEKVESLKFVKIGEQETE